MKRKLILIGGFYGIIVLFSMLQSCGLLRYDATICDIYFYGIQNSMENSEPDDLSQNIGFVILAEDYCKSAFNINGLNLISSCFATTKCADWQNGLNESSYVLTFDRQIMLGNDTIPPNTDLLKYENLMTGIKITTEESCSIILSTIVFSEELQNKLMFEAGVYNVTFKCNTTDGIEFVKQRDVILKK